MPTVLTRWQSYPDVQIVVAPTFCADRDEIDEAIDVLDGAIETVFG